MKKQLLFESIPFLFRKILFRLSFFTVLCLFTVHTSFAQQWNILGNETQISSVAATYTSITVLDNVPYVAFREGSIAKVKKRNTATGTWEQLGNDIGSNLTYTRIYLDKASNLFVTYVDASNGNKLAVKIYNTDTQIWEPLNGDSNNLYVSTGSVTNTVSQYSSTPRSSLAFDSDNKPYIAFGDGANLTPYVKKFDGTSWTTVGSAPVNASAKAVAVSLVIDEADVPWLVYCNLAATNSTTGTMALYQCNSGTWNYITPTVTAGIRHTSMALNSSGNLAIAYFNTATTNRATVIVYNKIAGTWSSATSLSSRDAPSISLIRDVSGSLYCSFIDNVSSTATFSARVFKQAAGVTAWTEMKDPLVARGIDEPVGNLTIATGSEYPLVVYTKNNSSSISTPVVRIYAPPPPPAVLSTLAVTNITTTSAETGGNITSDGGSAIAERGIVYNTSGNPTTANIKVVAATAGSGSYTVTIPGLNPTTLYYIRAYAINSGGTSYGDNVRLNTLVLPDAIVTTPKQMEFLNRGVVAVRKSSSQVFISWRLLGNDPAGIAFNIYRDNVKLNVAPITTSTNFLDNTASNGSYTVKVVKNNVEGPASAPISVWANNQLTIPLQIPAGGTTPDGKVYTYTANDASVGDVDGDGEYEIFLKWEPTAKNDNAGGYSGNQIFDCYKLNGTKLWRIDLGINMNAGPHFNQFMVYDFDGDGKAEIILKTADGSKDGTGVVIGNANVDYRNTSGWVQQGPEFLTVFNGLTGAAMATIPYQPARGNTSDWGDNYGNRQDRFVSAVAYLDGARPSLIVGRGYYDKLVRAAYDWRNGQLTLRWIFDSKDPSDLANNAISSQGNHQMTIGDVDGDGKDEIINGSSAINDNGKRLWTYGQGHGDALHMSDMDPDRPGQEIWQCLESPGQYSPYGIRLNDAKTGEMIFGAPTTGDVGRALAADIDPNHRGYEMWSSSGNLYNVQDGEIGTIKPTNGSQSVNGAVWWDGDLGRELLDGTIMDKWNPATKSLNRLFTIYQAAPVSSNNDTKKNPALTADLMGDWREEIILRRSDNTALILFTTTIPTEHRIYTLMHDPQYRTAIAWQNSGYNQPPHPSFFLGYDMAEAPVPNIEVKYISAPAVIGATMNTRADGCDAVVTYAAEADGLPAPNYTYTFTGATSGSGDGTGSGSVFNKGITNVTVTANNPSGSVNYSFDVTVIDSIAPIISVDNLTVATNEGCTATGVILTQPSISDNCTNTADLILTSDAPVSYPIGTTTVTWTVKDAQENVATAIQIVTVADNQGPVLMTPSAQNLCYNATYSIPTLGTNDNCGIASIVYKITGATERSGSGSDASGNFNVGLSTITWTVTDVNGNQTTGSTSVTVGTPLTVNIPDVYALSQTIVQKNTLYTGYGPTSFTIGAIQTGGTSPYTYSWNTGQTSASINVHSAGTYTVTVTDAIGCTSEASMVINVIDISCGNKNDKVMICHNGVAICVASSAVQAHLNHGCKLGSCTTTAKTTTTSLKIDGPSVSIVPEVLVYPNPSAGQFTVQLSGYKSSKADVIIMNMTGQIVTQKEVKLIDGRQTVAFNISNHAQGIYLLKVLSADGVNTLKIVLEK
ncbi:T9SS type A sorting domain-containing protein [Flavobacterium sp. ZT3R25]|uniref:rhamnogalacturonan lyase family protein n=1 Tax=Flavobacterium galactosi TaxID=3398735 RepID=UPI003A8C42E1